MHVKSASIVLGMTVLVPTLAHAGFNVLPAVQNIRPDSVDMVFESAHSATATLAISLQSNMAGATSTSIAAGTIRKVRISNLTSGTRYYYQVATDGQTSPIGTFQASISDGSRVPFRFVAYGDSRLAAWYESILASYGNNNDHLAVVQSIGSYAPNFVLHIGDYALDGTDVGGIRNFFSVEKNFLISMPLLATYGNHEFSGGSGATNTKFVNYLTPPPGAPNFSYYSYNYGNIHFLVISTGQYSDHDDSFDLDAPGSAQYQFVQNDLAAAKANSSIDQIFVSFHVPPYSAANFGDNDHLGPWFEPLFIQAGVKAVFVAHEHDYQHLIHNGITYILTGGAGGPILDVLNCNCQAGTKATLVDYKGNLNYVIVDVNGKTANFQVRGVQGGGNSSSWLIEQFSL